MPSGRSPAKRRGRGGPATRGRASRRHEPRTRGSSLAEAVASSVARVACEQGPNLARRRNAIARRPSPDRPTRVAGEAHGRPAGFPRQRIGPDAGLETSSSHSSGDAAPTSPYGSGGIGAETPRRLLDRRCKATSLPSSQPVMRERDLGVHNSSPRLRRPASPAETPNLCPKREWNRRADNRGGTPAVVSSSVRARLSADRPRGLEPPEPSAPAARWRGKLAKPVSGPKPTRFAVLPARLQPSLALRVAEITRSGCPGRPAFGRQEMVAASPPPAARDQGDGWLSLLRPRSEAIARLRQPGRVSTVRGRAFRS